jgi:hypothetical protein
MAWKLVRKVGGSCRGIPGHGQSCLFCGMEVPWNPILKVPAIVCHLVFL